MCPFLEPNTNAQWILLLSNLLRSVVFARLLQPLVQSARGSAGTLEPYKFLSNSFYDEPYSHGPDAARYLEIFKKPNSQRMEAHKVGTIDIGTNPSEPTYECGLGNRENPSEPTTLLPSPQYGKAEASEISDTFCWLKFSDFHQGLRDMISLNFLIFNQGPRDMIDLNFWFFITTRYGKS